MHGKDHRAVPMRLLAYTARLRGSARQHGKGEISSEKTLKALTAFRGGDR